MYFLLFKLEAITHMGPRTDEDVFAFAAIAWAQLAPQTIRNAFGPGWKNRCQRCLEFDGGVFEGETHRAEE